LSQPWHVGKLAANFVFDIGWNFVAPEADSGLPGEFGQISRCSIRYSHAWGDCGTRTKCHGKRQDGSCRKETR